MHGLPEIIGATSGFGPPGRVTLLVRLNRLNCEEQVGASVKGTSSEQYLRQVLACVLAGLLGVSHPGRPATRSRRHRFGRQIHSTSPRLTAFTTLTTTTPFRTSRRSLTA